MANTSTSHGFTSPSSSNVPASLADTSPAAAFSSHTALQEKQIKETVFYLRRALIPTDQKPGYVYVTKQADTRFCKVGWAGEDPAARIRAIENKCQVVTAGSYRVGPFFGAFRAERLLHCLLVHCRHFRQNCPCGCKNREWYKKDHQEVIRQAEIVCSWLCRDPCPYDRIGPENNLEPTWEQALERWLAMQNREVPPSWNTFFLFGPSVDVVMDHPCLLSPPSWPSQLLSGDFLKQLASKVANKVASRIADELIEEATHSTIKKRFRRHSIDSNEDNDLAPDMATSQLPRRDAPPKAKLAIDPETIQDETKGTLNEGTQAKRQETWNHWLLAPETHMTDGVVLEQQSYASGNEDIGDIAEMLARMPGAFPPEHIESAPPADTQVCLYKEPSVPYVFQDFSFITNADGSLCCEKDPDYNCKDSHENRYDIPALKTFLVDQNNLAIWVPGTPPITDELFSRVASCFRAEAQFPPFANASAYGGDTQVKSAGPGSPCGRTNDAGSTSTGSTSTGFPSTGSTSSGSKSTGFTSTGFTSTGSAPSTAPWEGNFSVLPWVGTAVVPFTPPNYLETIYPRLMTTYHSITAMYCYQKYSFEELRLADYDNRRRVAERRKPEFVDEDSDRETSSSLSDDDRPRAKQQGLEEELRDLGEESICYDYGLECQRMEYEIPAQRLRRLADNLRALSSQSTEKTQPPTWDDWPEEPSEDDSEDESWADSRGQETINEDDVDAHEHDNNATGTQTSPGHQQGFLVYHVQS